MESGPTDFERTKPRKIVVTVHGIRTFGQWQERLEILVRRADPSISVESYHYGYFSVVAFLIPPLRWIATMTFRRHIAKVKARNPDVPLTFVAHSFGTHLVAYAIYGMRPEERPPIDLILMAGSVLRSTFPWGELLDRNVIRSIVNDCGTKDNVLVLSQWCVLFTGMAGRLGFRGMMGSRFNNRYFDGGHSLYFENDGEPFDDFMERHWVPVILDSDSVARHDVRVSRGPMQGVMLTLLQISDPLKLLTYSIAIGVGIFYMYLAPRAEAAASRVQAQQEEAAKQVMLAKSYFEQRADVPRAVTALALAKELIPPGNASSIGANQILRYWLQYLKPIQEVSSSLRKGDVYLWAGASYMQGEKTSIKLCDCAIRTTSLIAGGGRIALIDNNDMFYIIDRNTLHLVWKFPLPPPKDAVQTNEQVSELEFSPDQFTSYLLKPDRKSWEFEREYLESKSRKQTEQSIDTEKSDSSRINYLNDPKVQLSKAETLDSATIYEDPRSHLLIVRGFTRHHDNAGGHMSYLVIDPTTGAMAGGENVDYAITEPGGCGHLRVTVERAFGGEKSATASLGERGQLPLIVYSDLSRGVAAGNRPYAPFETCRDGTVEFDSPESPLHHLAFPSLIREGELWTIKRAVTRLPEASPDSWKRDNPGVELAKVIYEYRAYAGLQVAGRPGGGEVLTYVEAAQRLKVMNWISGKPFMAVTYAPRYGAYTFCKFRNERASQCVFVRCLVEFCSEAYSDSNNLVAIASMKALGNDSFYVVDLAAMALIALPSTPDGAIANARFDPSGKLLSVYTGTGQIWIYRMDVRPVSVSRSSIRTDIGSTTLAGLNHRDARNDPVLADGDIIASLDDDSIARFDRFTGQPKWITGNFGMKDSGPVIPVVAGDERVIFVTSGSKLRLLDAQSGVMLSEAVDLASLAMQRGLGSNTDEEIDSLSGWAYPDGSVAVAARGLIFSRRRPQPIELVRSDLAHISQLTGVDRSFNQLDSLPRGFTDSDSKRKSQAASRSATPQPPQ